MVPVGCAYTQTLDVHVLNVPIQTHDHILPCCTRVSFRAHLRWSKLLINTMPDELSHSVLGGQCTKTIFTECFFFLIIYFTITCNLRLTKAFSMCAILKHGMLFFVVLAVLLIFFYSFIWFSGVPWICGIYNSAIFHWWLAQPISWQSSYARGFRYLSWSKWNKLLRLSFCLYGSKR